jgi:hypothetical protein
MITTGLDKILRKSKSASRSVVEISLKAFDIFCKDQGMERHLDIEENGFSPRIVQAVKYIDKMQQEKLISMGTIASALDLKPTRTSPIPNKEERQNETNRISNKRSSWISIIQNILLN